MANNRMRLAHRPSGQSIRLGKRMGWGWYGAPTEAELNAFYDRCLEHGGGQDDFVLTMEDADGAPCCTEEE